MLVEVHMLPACRVRSLDRVGPLVILPEAARHVLGLPPTRPRARAAFNPASVRLRMTLRSNSAFCSSAQNAEPAVIRSREWDQVQNGPPAPRIKPTHSRVLTQIDLSRF